MNFQMACNVGIMKGMKPMKFFAVFSALMVLSVPVMADTIIIPNSGSGEVTTRELPGNATIATGGGGPSGVYIQNDDDVLYRALVGRRHWNNRAYNNTAPVDGVTAACAGADRQVEYNRCMREAIRDQEELYRKYND